MIRYEKNDECTEVTASITGCKKDIVNRVRKFIGSEAMSNELIKAATIKDTFKSKVRCHAEDEFNESAGQQIAKRSLLDDYHKAANKAMNRVSAILKQQEQTVAERMERAAKKYAKYAH